MRSLAVIVLSALALFPAHALAKRETPVEQAKRTRTLLLGNGAEPRDLDPHVVNAFTDYNILVALFEGLTVLDEATSRPLPGVAEHWDISNDGLVYTFHLRADATWSNGDPVTAEDFVFSIERILSPELASQYAYLLFPLKGAEEYATAKTTDFSMVGARAIGPKTLQLTLAQPTPYLLSLTAHQAWFPVHKPTLLKFGKAHERGTRWTLPANFVGNGPFVLDVWEPEKRIVVKANPRHREGAESRIEQVVFFPYSDTAAEERAFRTGQLHATYGIPTSRIGHYRSQNPSPLRIEPLLETNFFRFNVTRPPFNDIRVRRALGMALDRETITRTVLQGTRLPAFSFVPPNTAGYQPTARAITDFETARRLLAEAGFPGGKGFPRVELQYCVQIIDPKVVEAIQEIWRRELGIEVALVSQEFRVHIDNQHSLSFQLSASRWIGDYDDPSTFTDLMLSQSGNNDSGWKNPTYDRLVAEAAQAREESSRHALLQKAEQLLIDEAPVTPLYFGTRTYLIRPEIRGWVPTLLGIHRYQKLSLE